MILTITLGLAGGGSLASANGSPSAPEVLISPLAGTPDASAHTQISFLGAPASELRDIVVDGSRSGTHSGKLEAYSTGDGASFIPARGFQPGERVTVHAVLSAAHKTTALGTSFTVADIYTLPRASPRQTPNPPVPTQSFHSRHDLRPPQVIVSTQASNPSLGDIFISPDSGGVQAGPMIIESSGALVWFKPVHSGTDAMNLRVQQYLGQAVLTWWQGEVIGGHGQGEDVIEDAAYQRIATVRAGNGLYADLHEFQITAQGTALITAYEPVYRNLASVGGSSHGIVDDSVLQEIDIRTGLVMFEWHALGHVALSESYARVPHIPDDVFDFFHINSIQQQSNGDLLIGGRNTWAAYRISAHNGYVLWRLGGKRSSFTVTPTARFAWQHDAELLPDGTISLFDNEDSPPEGTSSRVIHMALDLQHKTAELISSYEHPGTHLLSPSQGNVQLLAGEDRFVGWGQAGYVSEFSNTGQLTFDMHLPPPVNSYRAYRLSWNGQPKNTPTLVAAAGKHDTVVAYCSWNGAANVSAWRLLAGSNPSALKVVSTTQRQGFETEILTAGSHLYLRVQALDASGQVLASSQTVSS